MRFAGQSDTDADSGAERREMSSHRTRRIDRGTAEQLLRGAPANLDGPLVDLLAAAAAPAHASELAGEQTALAAYRQARLTPAAEPRRPSMIQTALAKLLTVKVAAATIGITALGGVALASGTLPTQAQDRAPQAQATPSQSAGAADGAGSPTAKPSAKDNEPKGTPSPSMVGLCKAYAAKPDGERGKALESPAFTALVTAAGGADKATAYCTAVLAAKASASPDAHASAKPSDKPDVRPTVTPSHPAAKKPATDATPTPRFTAN